MKSPILQPLRLFFSVTSRIAPFLAIRAAEKLFTTPPFSKRRDIEKEILQIADRFPIPMENAHQLAGYRWGSKTDPIILFVHGWTATATCFVNFIEPLCDMGYQVISYDAIAHGESTGRTVSATQWADTVIAAMKCVGNVECIIAHSMGAGAVVMASSLTLNTKALVLLSPATDIVSVTEKFADALSIPPHIIVKMRQYAWEKYYSSASKYGDDWRDVFLSDCKLPTLILHDRDDKEIDIKNARRLAQQWPWAKLIETKRLGHRRILLDPDVISAVRAFLKSLP